MEKAPSACPTWCLTCKLFGVTIPDSLNILASWKKHAASLSLAVPIGIDEDGQRCMLDIHERGHGPHGLIAGTTGSGKSELMITWILALAAVFSPQRGGLRAD